MSLIEALLLGLIQGLTEFLPISSTAHLTIAGRAMGLIDPAHPEHWTAFIAVVQLGTLIAVLAYFRRDIMAIIGAFLRENLTARRPIAEQSLTSRLGWYIIFGTIPIGVLGIALKHVIEGNLTKNLQIIGFSLIGLAILLEVAERTASFKRSLEEIKSKDAVTMGLMQCLALIPGASRSGTTITAGLFSGLTREAAARFSFLLSIPAVAASGLLELTKIDSLSTVGYLNVFLATAVAFVSGYWSIAFLLRYLRTRTTRVFVIYRLLLGVAILGAIYAGAMAP